METFLACQSSNLPEYLYLTIEGGYHGPKNTEGEKMNSYEAVIRKTLEIERILSTRYNACGQTFGEKIHTVRSKLPPQTVSNLYSLLDQRNSLIHHPDYKIDNRRFQSLASKTIRDLQGKKERRLGKKAVIGVGIAATAAGFMVNKLLKR